MSQCKGCGQSITWVPNAKSQGMTPTDPDGTNHFVTCPQRDQFRKEKRQKPAGAPG